MEVIIIFISPNGTTGKTAQIIGELFIKDGCNVTYIEIEKDMNSIEEIRSRIKNADIIGLGSPAYHMDFLNPLKIFVKDNLSSSIKAKVFFFMNYAGITSGFAFLNMSKILIKKNIKIAGAVKVFAPHFYQNEIFPSDLTIETVHNFYDKIRNNNFTEMTKKELKYSFKPQKIRTRLLYPFVHFVGKKRELQITINSSQCRKCKKCIHECVVNALSFEDSELMRNNSKCIHCYHCVVCCKFDAITAPISKLESFISMNKRIIGMENPINDFYYAEKNHILLCQK
ncbi:MAG: hypothetical protein A2015_12235 [Spirochaetes bacterium GWF1_31_7]|nr:MAG: hypothetical protein A2Y30_14840 [Spirochaetes bacterium GWE1_32_154]OHD49184.1 MAG: hypothetical protein A2015_12235 [Spirochaetes bacterium GWF1_31_7]OHD50231.1 MAG: hypothetical protein A2Y29_12890 [Spirochaetes bacterium GWE2_31_10]OHD76627.1 MAG: hypothetical protein A2355_13665 [Spirochaetes bacterium RIFOXYB1_FULL_32_8]HBD93987.1 hypothetical protein [Spirochaetia bacterium]